jgi:hypothetical protein
MSRNSRYFFAAIALLLSATLTVSVQAKKGGGGKPGGEDPPPPVVLPPVEYQVTHITRPNPTDPSEIVHVNAFSDTGIAVGYYGNLDDRRAWLYDPSDPLNPFSAVDLNDLPIVGLEGWVIQSAVGVNNNGLVVGYASPTGDLSDRRGFVLDLDSMEIASLPDVGWGWARGYARRVNDNGDILGFFERADGTRGAYLYNPGLRGAAADDYLEIVDVNAKGVFELNNPLPGFPSQIVGEAADGAVCEYTRGGTVSYRTHQFQELAINDYGDIAGRGSIEVPLRKNRTEIVQVVFRDTGVEEYLEGYFGIVSGLTNDGTVLIRGSGGNTLYVDGWEFVDVNSLIAPEDATGYVNNSRINNVGLPGFSEIACSTDFEICILTPVAISP